MTPARLVVQMVPDVLMRDAAVFVAWLAATVVLVRATWGAARRAFPDDSALQQIAHSIVGCWALIVLCALGLSAFGLLRAETVLPTVPLSALAASLLARRAGKKSQQRAMLAGADDAVFTAAWGIWLVFWLGCVVRCGLLEFPDDVDSLVYHIPLIDHWLQQGHLGPSGCAIWQFPGNNELLALWMTAPFSGDFLVSLANLPVACLLALATVDLAHQLRLGRAMSHLAGLAAVSNYVVLRQLVDNENDIAVAALFISALAYALRYARCGASPDKLWFAASAGLLAGVKYYATAYALIACGAGFFMALRSRGGRPAMRLAAAGMTGAAALAGYWYVRNGLATGAPFYPLGFSTSSDVLTHLRRGSVWSSTLLGNGRAEIAPWLAAGILASLGPLHLAMVASLLPTMAWLIWSGVALRQRADRAVDATGRLALAAVTVACGIALGVTPFGAETTPGTLDMVKGAYLPARFGLCFFTLAILVGIVMVDDLRPGVVAVASVVVRRYFLRARRAADKGLRITSRKAGTLLWQGLYAFFLVCLCWPLFPTPHRSLAGNRAEALLVSAAIVLTAGGLCAARIRCSRKKFLAFATTAAIVAGTGGTAFLSARWHAGFAANYDAKFNTALFSRLEKLAHGTRTCSLYHQEYPFFGSRRQLGVDRPLWVSSAEALIGRLRQHGVAYIAIASPNLAVNDWYANAMRWVKNDPGHFELLMRDESFSFYRVVE